MGPVMIFSRAYGFPSPAATRLLIAEPRHAARRRDSMNAYPPQLISARRLPDVGWRGASVVLGHGGLSWGDGLVVGFGGRVARWGP